jgi:hypothetical protein
MKYIVELASGGICIQSFMTISSGIQVLMLLQQQFERLHVSVTDRRDL